MNIYIALPENIFDFCPSRLSKLVEETEDIPRKNTETIKYM
jgi:hypothetical protein